MPTRAPEQHAHVAEVLGERRDVDLASLRLQLVHHPLQRANLTLVGMLSREQFDDLLHFFKLGWQRIEPRKLSLLPRSELLGHAWKIAVGAALLVTGPAHGQTINKRWDVEIRGVSGAESGDLRLEGTTGRILLAHDDAAFQPLQELRIAGGRISFLLPRTHQKFDGTVTDTAIHGTVRDSTGTLSTWYALPLNAASTLWPVPPRITVRQLLLGTSTTVERVSGSWLLRGPDTAQVEREYRDLARAVAISPLNGNARAERWRRFTLGLDASGPAAAIGQLRRMAPAFAADPEFRRLFYGDLDLHDAASSRAPHYLSGFKLTGAGRGMQLLGEIAGEADAATIREGGWRLWSRMATDSVAILARIDSLTRRDGSTGASVRALVAGYDEAVAWWRDAVRWLLISPWLETPTGKRSPVQLMAAFWGVDSLSLPDIRPTRFGDVAAMPVLSALHIGSHLVRPLNASATEWLAQGGMQEAFDAWRPIRWGEIPLIVSFGGHDVTVVSPWAQANARPSAFFGDRDAIRVDPGITPLAAVATILHEWHHLIASQRRLSGAHPPALVDGPTQLQLLEDDPWLAEGFAEWATEETLRPAATSGALLRFTQAEKRLAIADRDPDDPHPLGYRLIRAAANGRSVPVLRDLLVANLHDLNSVARRLKLSVPSPQLPAVLHRPANFAVIPSVTFSWDEGSVFDLSRRLVIPDSRPQH